MKLGPYEVRTELARTARAAVARATSPSGTEVALTLVRADQGDRREHRGADGFGRFERERRVVEALSSADGFVPVIDAGLAEQGAWFAQPFLHGGSLRDTLAAGELPVEQLIRLVRGVASALARAHDRGLVHGELTPESIFVSDGQPFIADLVLARYFPAKPAAPYAAPELAHGPATPRSDVYALGAILREALRGASPRREIAQAIERACAPEPARRFEDARGFLRALGGGVGPAVHAPTRVDEDDALPPVAPVYPDPPRPSPASAPGAPPAAKVAVLAVLLVLSAIAAVVLVELRHRAEEASERRFFEVALREGHDAAAALHEGEALPSGIRSKPQVQNAIASLRSEVRAAEARAEALAALGKLGDETAASVRLEAAEKALAADPRCARALVERARARLVLGRGKSDALAEAREAARADLERAVALDGSLAVARFELAALLRRSREGRARARAELEKAAALDADGVLGLVARGEVASLDRKYEDALAAFTLAIARKKDAVLPLLARARLRLAMERDMPGAVEDATRAAELAPARAEPLLLRGWGRAKTVAGGEKLPLEDLDRAVALDPLDAPARALRALAHYRTGDRETALTDANKAMELDASEPAALLTVAELLVFAPSQGTQLVGDRAHMDEARKRLAEAIERDPELLEALVVDTVLSLATQDFAGCLDRTERGLALQPAHPTLLANRAIAFTQLGRRDDALALLDKAIEQLPELDVLRYLRGKLRVERQPPDFQGAADDLTAALAKRRVHPEAWFYRAYALHQLGRYKEAIEDYDQAERATPGAPYIPRLRQFREDARARLQQQGR